MAPHIPRLAVYGAASTACAGGVVALALHTRPNFFAAAVAIGRSSGALMVLANFALFNVICLGIAFKAVFFGRLRSIEYEHLFERLWLFITESLLALTIFRRDFSMAFMVLYGTLLFLKCFHWITADRVDYMDQVPPPGPPILFHIRSSTVILLLSTLDLILVVYCLEVISIEGVSAMVLFASEFMILWASINGTAARYIVGLIDLRRARGREDAPTWEAKSMYIFYIDLIVDFAKLLTYLAFFTVIFLHYGLPLHILRDVYMTFRSFLSRCGDLVRYRRATRDMDALYPDATPEEMDRLGDPTCIICREELVVRRPGEEGQGSGAGAGAGAGTDGGPNDTPKKLVCGHVFHFYCLRSWLERQQSCPTCRRDVLRPTSTTSSTRAAARAAPPAAPQPGAQPHPQPGVPAPTPHPEGDNAQPRHAPPASPLDRLQAVYDDFFRVPGQHPIQAQQQQVEHQRPSAPPTQHQSGAAPHPTATHTDDADHAIQRGIWGGPIQPGKFFPAPLGAGPRLPPAATFPNGNPQIRFNIPDRSRTVAPDTPQADSSSGPSRGSNSVTVLEDSNPAKNAAAMGETEAAADETPEAARRRAAEAAMRRFGLAPPPEQTPSTSSPITSSSFSSDMIQSEGVPSRKGKEKARIPSETWNDEPTHLPFLTDLNGDTPGIRHSTLSKWEGTKARIHLPGLNDAVASTGDSGGDTSQAIGDRLKVLREVDEVIRGLVEELNQLQVRWDRENDAGRNGVDQSSSVGGGLELSGMNPREG